MAELRRTWAEINLDNLCENLAAVRRRVGEKPKLLCVVKADAYGHGALFCARALARSGADYFAVANLDEAEELRRGGVTLPILILGVTPADCTERLIQLDLTQAVSCLADAQQYHAAAAALGRRLRVHLKLNTGMGRLGFCADDAHREESLREIRALLSFSALDTEGVFTHFAVADEPSPANLPFSQVQYERFCRSIEQLECDGFRFRLRHCCNSGAITHFPAWGMDMVRCGIILYGGSDAKSTPEIRPVMSLKTIVAAVQEMDEGVSISYGRTFFTPRRSRIAVLPIGYADGLLRAFSGKLRVKTPYGVAAQVGRICMDMCMIDVTELPEVRVGDEVEIFGEQISYQEAAAAAGTIPWELTCAVSQRVPRVYLRDGKVIARHNRLLDGAETP